MNNKYNYILTSSIQKISYKVVFLFSLTLESSCQVR